MASKVTVIGAGLAGSEAAWQIAMAGFPVELIEMRPEVSTPAHSSPFFAELVCSNSLGSDREGSAPALLKDEMRALGSIILECAGEAKVPAGQALAVDRQHFAGLVTARVEGHPLISVRREEALTAPAEGVTIIATGPLTSEAMAEYIAALLGDDQLFFYDAAAPIVEGTSVDWSRAFWASRYGKGEADYANCPMNRDEYTAFWKALVEAERTPLHEFESMKLFEACVPVEELGRRDVDTLRYGPLKPVGLDDPRTGQRPYAVVQLRREDASGSMFNLVGFQTRLTRPEQRRVFRMIPGLESAQFVRYGMMHRNTYINGPAHLLPTLQLKSRAQLLFAGQITGVEGYMESAATGIAAGINAARMLAGHDPVVFPEHSCIGALCAHVSTPDHGGYQPMNINFGLLPQAISSGRKEEKRLAQIKQARKGLFDVLRMLGRS